MKFRKFWIFLAIIPFGMAIYWFVCIRPYIQIDNAHLAASTIEVRADIPGALAHIHKEEGSWVEKGEILFSYSITEEKADLAEMQINLDSLHHKLSGHLTEAETAMQEYLNARSEEAIGFQDFSEQPLTRLGEQQTQAERCKKEMEELRNKIELAKIAMQRKHFVSPASGFVIERKRVAGEQLLAGDLVCSLCNAKEIWIEALVPESAASKIKLGQRAIARLPSDLSLKWEGVVAWISPIALPKHVGIPIRISLKEGYPDCLRPNLQVQLDLKIR